MDMVRDEWGVEKKEVSLSYSFSLTLLCIKASCGKSITA
jgi:hypothetical protein